MATNAGLNWTKEEDDELLEKLISNPDAQYEIIAEHFKRTPGSVQNRALSLVLRMSGPDNPLEDLCHKYNLDLKEMDKYKAKKDNRTQVRRDSRKNKRASGEGGGEISNNNDTLAVLRDIRTYMKQLVEKFEK
jgi:hypothetical protein